MMKMFNTENSLKHSVPTLLIGLVAAALLWFTFTYFIELSIFAILLAKVSIGLFLASLVDNFVLRDFETVKEIKQGNVALAILWAGYMAVIVAALISV